MAHNVQAPLDFESLHLEGALFFSEQLADIAHGRAEAQTAQDYRIPRGLKLRDEIGRAYRIAQALWQDFSAQCERRDMDAAQATATYVQQLLEQTFGFDRLVPAGNPQIGEVCYPLSFMARHNVPVVVVPHDLTLDAADGRFGDGGRRRSGFRLLQEFLNASPECLWGLVSNGRQLRLLRDNASLTRPAYLEADLARLFTEESYADFSALWHLLHASRFPQAGEPATDCILERWRNSAREEGARARDKLRAGVTQALLALGDGFLQHSANHALRQKLTDGALSQDAYFQQLLRLVYRLIFWFTIEDRGLLHPPNAGEDAKALYGEGYASSPLRKRALRAARYDRHADAWHAVRIVFAGLDRGQPLLALPTLGGLFAVDQCPDLDAAELPNRGLLQAVRDLAWFRHEQVLTPVNYRAMQTEEFGSVYESLLELTPAVDVTARRFDFPGLGNGGSRGNARKLTGSYYTPDALVQELLKTALDPVIERTLQDNPAEPVAALRALTVLDPAVGSGHFLIAAAHHIAERIAYLAAADGNPGPTDHRRALRDVVSNCLYGVDRNPMALELARMALWLEGFAEGRPLSFLDHHLQVGDALLGLTDLNTLDSGIAKDAFKPLSGDDKELCQALAKANTAGNKQIKKDLKSGQLLLLADPEPGLQPLQAIEAMPAETPEQVRAKQQAWQDFLAQSEDNALAHAADVAVGAYLLSKTDDMADHLPTSITLHALLTAPKAALQDGSEHLPTIQAAREACRQAHVFHWPLAFPQVFTKGGFDCVLTNPPWDVSQMDEREYFSARAPEIADLAGDKRKQAIANLSTEHPALWQAYVDESHRIAAANNFYRGSGRFELAAFGKLNTYPLFSETILQVHAARGRAGFIVPTGIATDDGNKAYFGHITQSHRLVSLFDFENRDGIFPSVHRSYKFCLLTLGQADAAEFVCFATDVAQLDDPRRRFTLTPEEFQLINPNTLTCPVFRSERDAELTKKLYRAAPVLLRETVTQGKKVIEPEQNPWGITFSQGLFNMTSASNLFLESPEPDTYPLYEAKLIHQFDSRFGSFIPDPSIPNKDWNTREVSLAEKQDPVTTITPRYWVDRREVWMKVARLPDGLLKALKENDGRATVLCITQLLFGQWLAERRESDPSRGIYPAWQAFVQRHPYATDIAPTQLGFCGNNPAEFRPLNDNYLPAEGENNVTVYRPGHRNATAWYAVDKQAEAAILALAADRRQLTPPEEALHDTADVLALAEHWLQAACPNWLMGWRGIARVTDERSVIGSIMPLSGIGNSCHLLEFAAPNTGEELVAAFVANISSLVFDFVARQKIGGANFNFYIPKQLPILRPENYTETDLDFIVPRVLELTYTAHDLAGWAADLGHDGPPFAFDPERRARLRAELDAYYARLYGLTRDELRYILDPADLEGPDYPSETFRVLKNKEMREHGEYRTRRLVLEAWGRLTEPSVEAMQ